MKKLPHEWTLQPTIPSRLRWIARPVRYGDVSVSERHRLDPVPAAGALATPED